MLTLNAAALAISAALFDSVWEGAILFGVVWIVLRLLPNLSASTRYAIWLCTLLALILVPAGTMFLTSHPIERPAPAPVADSLSGVSMAGESSVGLVDDRVESPSPPANARITVPQGVALGVAALWGLLTALRLTLLLRDFQRLALVRRGARLWTTRYAFPVWTSSEVSVPVAVGFLRPGVFLPQPLLEDQSADALDAIVLHEIAHLRRYDVWTNALARIAEAFAALNPIAWLVIRQLAVEREIACDDSVVSQLGSGETFARALATIAVSDRRRVPIAAPSAVGSQQSIVTRIERLLEAHPRPLRLSLSALGGALMFIAVIAFLMQSISPVLAYAPQSASSGPALLAAACATPNRPVQMEGYVDTSHGRKTIWESPWPLSTGVKYWGSDKIAILEVTVNASGKAQNVSVVSTPDRSGAQIAVRRFEKGTYRPAVKNCVNVASTFRTWFPVRSNQQRLYSIVSAAYPKGWSNEHPSACRVPDLIHGGVPSVAGLNAGKHLTASIRVDVDTAGGVSNAAIVNSSGNTSFDNATLAAARGATYPLNDSTGFKPVRPSGKDLSWNATHGYSAYSKCSPLPTRYVWTATFEPVGTPLAGH